MIKKIISIKNIGKFTNFQSSGDITFGKETIIFGKNANGKSTLTDIFRSLKDNNSNILIGRKSFSASENSKKIEILLDQNKTLVFRNKKWYDTLSSIIIFDAQFITENIFSIEISDEHKTQMHRIILGEEGKKLAKKLDNLRSELHKKEWNENGTRDFSNKFEFKDSYSIENFCNIQLDREIVKKIVEKEKELNAAKSIKEIQQLPKLECLNWQIPNFEDINQTFNKTLKTNHEATEKKVLQHINENWSNPKHSKSFINDGLSLLKEKSFLGKQNCVFCGQNLEKATKLISAYQELFNTEYENLKVEILDKAQKFKNWNYENYLTSFFAQIEKNISTREKWQKYLDDKIDFTDIKNFILDSKKNILNAKTLFEAEILKKEKDINYKIKFDSFINLQKIWNKIDELTKNKNNEIQNFNSKIDGYLKDISTKNISEIEKELKKLKVIQKRFESKWKKFCDDYLELKNEINDLKKQRDAKEKELDEFSEKIFQKYETKINEFLKKMHADFKIENFESKSNNRGKGKHFTHFGLKFFDEHSVNLQGEITEPHFKNTLSESDKRLLAFAFFCSILANDNDLNQKIVIFDDPISSFDEERRLTSVAILADFNCVQKIILTHEKNFMRDILMEHKFESAKLLKIQYFKPDNTSKIVLEDREIFLANEIERKIKRLQKMLEDEDYSEYEKDCRTVLEFFFKIKHLEELKNEINKRGGIRTFSEKLFDTDNAQKTNFLRLCDYLNIPLHDGTLPQKSEGDIKTILSLFFRCLKEI